MMVLLPLPDCPTSATVSPASITRLKSRSTTVSGREGYAKMHLRNSTCRQEKWDPVERALEGDAAVPMALLDPLLDAIQGQLDARATDVEKRWRLIVRRPMRL